MLKLREHVDGIKASIKLAHPANGRGSGSPASQLPPIDGSPTKELEQYARTLAAAINLLPARINRNFTVTANSYVVHVAASNIGGSGVNNRWSRTIVTYGQLQAYLADLATLPRGE